LLNPVEAVVLAHQPVDGATYTAAKLTHLGRVVVYQAGAMNAIPALAGLLIKGAPPYYPAVHMAAGIAVGGIAGLLCCALYGWLMRFIPARRLKAAGQLAMTLPFACMVLFQPVAKAVAAVVFGIRSLSADYLIRVSALVHAGSSRPVRLRRSRMAGLVARFFGGQPARAGFAFAGRLMLRDWQFRRALAASGVGLLLGFVPLIAGAWRSDPFSPAFTPMHLLPHAFGVALGLICQILPYGNDYKAVWVFQLAPASAMAPLARGVYALLWIELIVMPHLVLLPFLAWRWAIWKAALFAAYSLAAGSFYIGLELRLIDGLPFSRQMNPAAGAALLPVMLIGGAAIAVAVLAQYALIFRSPAAVGAATAAIAAGAYFVTRSSLRAFEGSIRYNLSLISVETTALYKEVRA
jgi:hypothetical protein